MRVILALAALLFITSCASMEQTSPTIKFGDHLDFALTLSENVRDDRLRLSLRNTSRREITHSCISMYFMAWVIREGEPPVQLFDERALRISVYPCPAPVMAPGQAHTFELDLINLLPTLGTVQLRGALVYVEYPLSGEGSVYSNAIKFPKDCRVGIHRP